MNHAQVASGEVDQGVVDNDIDAEITEEEAHNNYGIRVADWLALSALHLELLDGSQAQQSLLNFVQYEKETEEFLEPFITVANLERVDFVTQYVSDIQVLYNRCSNIFITLNFNLNNLTVVLEFFLLLINNCQPFNF